MNLGALDLAGSWFSPRSRLARLMMGLESYGVPLLITQCHCRQGLHHLVRAYRCFVPARDKATVSLMTDLVERARVS
jgi:hypothetical protein